MVELTVEEKRQMCIELAQHLPKLREVLNVTQAELGRLCGFSRSRISMIENMAIEMSWSQLTSILFVALVNPRGKEYFYANRLLGPRFLQFMQRKEANIPPDTNILVRTELILSYDEFLRLYREHEEQEAKQK